MAGMTKLIKGTISKSGLGKAFKRIAKEDQSRIIGSIKKNYEHLGDNIRHLTTNDIKLNLQYDMANSDFISKESQEILKSGIAKFDAKEARRAERILKSDAYKNAQQAKRSREIGSAISDGTQTPQAAAAETGRAQQKVAQEAKAATEEAERVAQQNDKFVNGVASAEGEGAQAVAEEVAKDEATASRAASAENGSADKIKDAVSEAVDEEEARAWYDTDESRANWKQRIANQKAEAQTTLDNNIKSAQDEYNLVAGKHRDANGILDDKNEDVIAAKKNMDEKIAGFRKAHENDMKELESGGPGVMDWVQGNGIDQAVLGIGALGFAGAVAFGGAKSNSDLYGTTGTMTPGY